MVQSFPHGRHCRLLVRRGQDAPRHIFRHHLEQFTEGRHNQLERDTRAPVAGVVLSENSEPLGLTLQSFRTNAGRHTHPEP